MATSLQDILADMDQSAKKLAAPKAKSVSATLPQGATQKSTPVPNRTSIDVNSVLDDVNSTADRLGYYSPGELSKMGAQMPTPAQQTQIQNSGVPTSIGPMAPYTPTPPPENFETTPIGRPAPPSVAQAEQTTQPAVRAQGLGTMADQLIPQPTQQPQYVDTTAIPRSPFTNQLEPPGPSIATEEEKKRFGTMGPAPEPSFGQKVAAAVIPPSAEDAIRQTMPKIADALDSAGLMPNRVYDPDAPNAQSFVSLEDLASAKSSPFTNGILQGIDSLASPQTVAWLAAGPLLDAPGLAGRLVTLGFGSQMASGVAGQIADYQKAVKAGDMQSAKQILGQMLPGAIAAVASIKEGLKTQESGPLSERGATNSFLKAIGLREPAEIPETLTPAAAQAAETTEANAKQQLLSNATPVSPKTVGVPSEPTVAESPKTLQAQTDALAAGTNPVVYFPKGTGNLPEPPENAQVTVVPGNKPGAGTYYHTSDVKPTQIKKAVANGTYGDLLGYEQPKGEALAGQPVAVTARTPDGEAKAALVDQANPEATQAQTATLQKQFPNATVGIEPPQNVIASRTAPAVKEGKFDTLKDAADELLYEGADVERKKRDDQEQGGIQDRIADIEQAAQKKMPAGALEKVQDAAQEKGLDADGYIQAVDRATDASPEEAIADIKSGKIEQDVASQQADLDDVVSDNADEIDQAIEESRKADPELSNALQEIREGKLIGVRDAKQYAADKPELAESANNLADAVSDSEVREPAGEEAHVQAGAARVPERPTEPGARPAEAAGAENAVDKDQAAEDAEKASAARTGKGNIGSARHAEAEASAKRLGSEFEEGERQHLTNRLKSILRNPKATEEERSIAQSQLKSLEEGARGNVPLEPGSTSAEDAKFKDAGQTSEEVATSNGKKGVEAYTHEAIPGLAVTKSPDGPEWRITHTRTGRAVTTPEIPHNGYYRTPQAAFRDMKKLAPVTDWTQDFSKAKTSEMADLRDKINRALTEKPKAGNPLAPEGEKSTLKPNESQPESATGQLGAASRPALERVSSEPVSPTEVNREAGRSGAERLESNAERPGEHGAEGRDALRRGVGSGEGTVPVPAEREGRAESRREPGQLTRPGQSGLDYRITPEDHIGEGSPRQKFNNNVSAIKSLRTIESEGRNATAAEQQALVKYVGWGGLPQAFNLEHAKFGKEAADLKELLTPAEYRSARASTKNAHYTSPQVIQSVWDAIRRLGFRAGRMLEPSAGVGHFIGMMPADLSVNSAKTAVELDSLTGRLLRQLYQTADTRIQGFEKFDEPDGTYDLAVSNVPFGDYKVHDIKYNKDNLSIHNYFIAKMLDKVRPGGVAAIITSHHTLDALDSSARKVFQDKGGDLLGAIRLPGGAFKKNAGTDVTTDILFFKKRGEGEAPGGEDFLKTAELKDEKTGQPITVNEYFAKHPDMMLGKMALEGSMYRENEPTLVAHEGKDLQQLMKEAVSKLPENKFDEATAPRSTTLEASDPGVPRVGEMKPYGYAVKDGKVYQKVDGKVQEREMPSSTVQRVKGMLQLRDATREMLHAELADRPATEQRDLRARLNRFYDAFTKKHGFLNSAPNMRALKDDPDLPFLLSLEKYDKEKNAAAKSDIFFKSVVSPRRPVESVKTPKEALLVSLNEKGRLDTDHMGKLLGVPPAEVEKSLLEDGLAFKNPQGFLETKDSYLSGNVRQKLRDATAANKDGSFKANVEALKAVQPKDLEPHEINVALGAPWIPPETVGEFVNHLLQRDNYSYRARTKVTHVASQGAWDLDYSGFDRGVASTQEWGTRRASAIKLLNDMLNQQMTQVFDYGPNKERIFNEAETLAANEKRNKIAEEFQRWAYEDPIRAKSLTNIYNDKYNSTRLREYDGSHLTLPGSSSLVELRPHQKHAIWRFLQDGVAGLYHVVGAGKTYSIIGSAMEGRRLGLYKKPMVAVPNHLVGQWARDFQKLYPEAKVLAATKEDFAKGNRQKFMSRVATGDWDAVIVPHSSFGLLPLSAEVQKEFLNKQIDDLESHIMKMKRGDNQTRLIKQLENAKSKLEAKILALSKQESKDTTINFDDMGVDALMVDEAHCFPYKALVATNIGHIPIGEIVEKHLDVQVISFNIATQKVEWKSITQWHRNKKLHPLVRVEHEQGSFVCTSNHSIWTCNRGYAQAGTLTREDELLREKDLCSVQDDILVQEFRASEQSQKDVLLLQMQGDLSKRTARMEVGIHVMDQRSAAESCEQKEGHEESGSFSSDEVGQSNAPSGSAGQDEEFAAWADLSFARREWSTNRTTENSRGRIATANRSGNRDCCGQTSIRVRTKLLQSGYRGQVDNASDRGGREDAPTETLEIFGQKEGANPQFIRVVRVTFLEQGDYGESSRCSAQSERVYCLGIADNHNFFADGILVSNSYKNLFFPTKMGRVAGIPNASSQRAMDMYMKTQHILNKNNGRGVMFATGTPISNSMAEAWTMMRYLDPKGLEQGDLQHFDSFAAQFGKVVPNFEVSPGDPTKFRVSNRFSKFTNVPELARMFLKYGDVKTQDDLHLPQPELEGGKPETVTVDPSERVQSYVKELGTRADRIRGIGGPKPDPSEDNMLKITGEGRKVALDYRAIDKDAPDDANSKITAAARKIAEIYHGTRDKKLTQAVMLDISTPSDAWNGVHLDPEQIPELREAIASHINDGMNDEQAGAVAREAYLDAHPELKRGPKQFDAYDDLRRKLQMLGVPKDQVAFIHEAKTDAAKQSLFDRVNKGEIGVIVGSTAKMGVGTNIQRLLYAMHHIDAPWRPADIEQRNGRILRQGNTNEKVRELRYATTKTFDSYMWQLLENKAGFISQFEHAASSGQREMEDVDGRALSYAEVKALSTGDPRVMDKIKNDIEVSRLQKLKQAYQSNLRALQIRGGEMPLKIEGEKTRLANLQDDLKTRDKNKLEKFSMQVGKDSFSDRKQAGAAVNAALDKAIRDKSEPHKVGEYAGFDVYVTANGNGYLLGKGYHYFEPNPENPLGTIQSIESKLRNLEDRISGSKDSLERYTQDQKGIKEQLAKPFEHESKLDTAIEKQQKLDDQLRENAPDPQAAAQEEERPTGTGERGGATLDFLLGGIPHLFQKMFGKQEAKPPEPLAEKPMQEVVGPQVPEKPAETGVPTEPEGEDEFAGNLRMAKFDKPQDVLDVIRKTAKDNAAKIDEQRRGKISQKETKQAAEDLDFSDRELRHMKPGTALNAEELYAARGIMLKSASDVRDASAAADKSPTVENVLKAEELKYRHIAIQQSVHGAVAEAGRALAQQRMIVQALDSGDRTNMDRVMGALGGRKLSEDEMRRLSQIPDGDLIGMNRFLRDTAKFKTSEKINAYWISNILSAPTIPLRKFVGISMSSVLHAMERPIEAAIDIPMSKLQGRERETYFREALAGAGGYVTSLPHAMRQGIFMLQNGFSLDRPGSGGIEVPHHYELPGNLKNPLNWGTRAIASVGTFFRVMAFNGEKYSLAAQQAVKEGLHGDAFKDRMTDLIANPSQEIISKAWKQALVESGKEPPDRALRHLLGFINEVPALRFVSPFTRISWNLAKMGGRYSPLGFARLAKDENYKGPQASRIMAEAALGTAILSGLAYHVAQGNVTGPPPSAANDRDAFYRAGKQPFSVKIGNRWVSYTHFLPGLSTSLAAMAAWHDSKTTPNSTRVGQLGGAIGQAMLDQSFMLGIKNFFDAMEDPDRFGPRMLTSIAGGFVPMSGADRIFANALDPTVRRPEGMYQAIKANLPILSKSVPPEIDALGRPSERRGGSGIDAFLPSSIPEAKPESDIDAELGRLEKAGLKEPGFAGRVLTLEGDKIPLDRRQQEEYQKIRGLFIQSYVGSVMKRDDYATMDDEQKVQEIEQAIRDASDDARDEMKNRIYQRMPSQRIASGVPLVPQGAQPRP